MFNIKDFMKQSERAIEMHEYLKAYTALKDKWVKMEDNLQMFLAQSDYRGAYVTKGEDAVSITIVLFDSVKIKMRFSMFKEKADRPFLGRLIIEEEGLCVGFKKWFRYDFDQEGLLHIPSWGEEINMADERDAGNIFLHIFHEFKERGLS